ncbi:unnamed protein product [Prorocentrum cordatum]|uniref:HECT-type E3 ubiquitin transferase n=1 Tax=Prorocentrum cordatum TaxID=2364126 RepID=A0ABN9WUD1_9DINO|nr:unnamed protein product [Polarella glacialis]
MRTRAKSCDQRAAFQGGKLDGLILIAGNRTVQGFTGAGEPGEQERRTQYNVDFKAPRSYEATMGAIPPQDWGRVQAGSGGLTRGGNEPVFAIGNYYCSIEEYSATASSKCTLASSGMFHDAVKVGVGLCVGDPLKLTSMPLEPAAEGTRDAGNLDAECLGDSGKARGCQQNGSKAKIAIAAYRRGAARWLARNPSLVGKMLPELRHLEGIAATSGGESYTRSKANFQARDTSLIGKLRPSLQSGARAEVHGTHRSWPSLNVWRRWKLTPVAPELALRGPCWRRDVRAKISQHIHFLVGFFGDLAIEGAAGAEVPILGADGAIDAKKAPIHLWAVQLANGIDALLFASIWHRAVRLLLQGDEMRDVFAAIDPRATRGKEPGHVMRGILSLLAPDNRCLTCETVFRSRGHCSHHFLRGRPARRFARLSAAQLWQRRPSDCLQCPICKTCSLYPSGPTMASGVPARAYHHDTNEVICYSPLIIGSSPENEHTSIIISFGFSTSSDHLGILAGRSMLNYCYAAHHIIQQPAPASKPQSDVGPTKDSAHIANVPNKRPFVVAASVGSVIAWLGGGAAPIYALIYLCAAPSPVDGTRFTGGRCSAYAGLELDRAASEGTCAACSAATESPGGNRRNKGDQKATKAIQFKDRGLRELLMLIIKQALKNSQAARMLDGAMLDAIVFPRNRKLAQVTQGEQGASALRVEAFRAGKAGSPNAEPLRTPHTLFFAALVEAAAAMESRGGANMGKTQVPREDINACEREEDAEQLARACRLAKTAQEDQVKMTVAVQTFGAKGHALLDGLRQAGGRHLRGSAPAGYMEEELQDRTEQRAWFLQFATGTSRVPVEGFKGLVGMRGSQKFSIHRAFGADRLPSAHTCFNQLDLPEYPSEEVLREKLVQAVSEGHEGFGFA